jgi:integrase
LKPPQPLLGRGHSDKKATTQRSEGITAKHLTPFLGKYAMAAITSELAASYRDKRIAEGKANNTIRIGLAMLSNLFTIAIQEGGLGLTYNPVTNIRKPSPAQGRDRRLSADEQARLLATVDCHSNPMLAWIVRIAIETGMRQSEILNLRVQHMDLASRVARLFDTKNNSARTVPLSAAATAVLKAAVENPIRPANTDLIFFEEAGRDGKRRPYQFVKIWGGIKQALGMDDLHFHDLRHEAVSRLVEGGLSDQEVTSISGHKSMRCFADIPICGLKTLLQSLTASCPPEAGSPEHYRSLALPNCITPHLHFAASEHS